MLHLLCAVLWRQLLLELQQDHDDRDSLLFVLMLISNANASLFNGGAQVA